MCQWCRTIVAKGAVTNHEKLCKEMPYNTWLRGIRLLCADLQTEVRCRQCGTCFLEAKGCARHAHECRLRRIKAGLPTDTGEYHVLPPLAQVAIARGAHAASARAQELEHAATAARHKFAEIIEHDPAHVVSQAVLQASCCDAETGMPCTRCRSCQKCREHKCWGACGRCKQCRACSRALLADSLVYM